MITIVARVLAVLALLGSAWIHFDLWTVGYQDIEIVGPLFLVNAVAGVVIAVAVALWRHWLPALATVGFGAATLGAYLLSVTVGLFGMQNDFSGTPALLAAIAEAVCVVAGAVLLLRQRTRVGRAA